MVVEGGSSNVLLTVYTDRGRAGPAHKVVINSLELNAEMLADVMRIERCSG